MKLFVQRNLGLLVSAFVLFVTVLTASIAISIMGFEASSDATSVRSIYLGNVETENQSTVLTSEMNAYLRDARLVMVYQGHTFQSDLTFLAPDIQATMNALIPAQNNQAIFRLSETQEALLFNRLSAEFNPTIIAALDQEALVSFILSSAANMNRFNYIELSDFMLPSAFTRLHHVEIQNVSPIDGLNITSRASSITIPASSQFSLLDALGNLFLENRQLSIIASGMLGVLPYAGVTNVQRTMHEEPPLWMQEGMNVRILQLVGQDLTFINLSDTPYEIRVIGSNNNSVLSVELWGYPPLVDRSTELVQTLTLNPLVDIINDPTLNANTPDVTITETDTEIIYEVVVSSGVSGRVLDLHRTSTTQDGQTVTTLFLREIYEPQNATVRRNVVMKEVD